jgi:hypothetical protein
MVSCFARFSALLFWVGKRDTITLGVPLFRWVAAGGRAHVVECAALLVLIVIISLGHSLWTLIRWMFAAPFEQTPGSAASCVGCGQAFAGAPCCPRCGLNPTSARAGELRDLEAMARFLQRMREANDLDQETCERLYRRIEERQCALLHDRPLPVAVDAVGAGQPTALTADDLDRLLCNCGDVRRLPFAHRRLALAWYENSFESEGHRLSFFAQRRLAYLLSVTASPTDTLRVYRSIIERDLAYLLRGEVALEAAQFANRIGRLDEALWFVERALQDSLSFDQRRGAERLLNQLRSRQLEAPPEQPAEPARAPEAVVAAVPTVEPPPPRRRVGEVLAAFMEERNILWGELVGGMLMVGCSVALVISLWRTLEQIPYFPFLIFAALTAALFGTGFYTLSHWKLQSTSRGLLVVATLLLPLNFLVLAGLPAAGDMGWLEVVFSGAALAAFTWMLRKASRVLLTHSSEPAAADWWLPVAVLGSSASLLLTPNWISGSTALLALLASIPAACFGGPSTVILRGLARGGPLQRYQAGGLLVFLGTGLFALGVVLGFLLYLTPDLAGMLHIVAVPAAIAGVPLLFGGLLIQERFEGESSEPEDEALSTALPSCFFRQASTATIVIGLAFQALALALAWPGTVAMPLACGVTWLALSSAAFHFRRPAHYPAAIVAITLGCLVAFHGWIQPVEAPLLFRLASAESATPLTVLGLVIALVGEMFTRLRRPVDGAAHALSGAAVALLALFTAASAAGANLERTCMVFGILGFACLLANVRWRRPVVTSCGAIALFVCVLASLILVGPALSPLRQLCVALLAHATTLIALASLLAIRREMRSEFAGSLRSVAVSSSCLAGACLANLADWQWLEPFSLCVVWLAVAWLVLAETEREPLLLLGGQAALSVAVISVVSIWLRNHDRAGAPDEVFAIANLQSHGIGLSLLALLWATARLANRAGKHTLHLLHSGWTLDIGVRHLVLVGQLALVVWGVLPFVFRELNIPAFSGFSLDEHRQVLESSAWMLQALLALLTLLELWERGPAKALRSLVLVAVTASVLVAGQAEQAVTARLAWLLAGCFLCGSMLLWIRDRLVPLAEVAGIKATLLATGRTRRLLLLTAAVPTLLLSAALATKTLVVEHMPAPTWAPIVTVITELFPLVVIAAGLVGHGRRERSPGYVFSAGLLATAFLATAYAVWTAASGIVLDNVIGVRVGQIGVLGLAAWSFGWLALRTRSAAWTEIVDSRGGRRLMSVEMLLAKLIFVTFGLCALIGLLARAPAESGGYPAALPVTTEFGSLLGWGAFLALVVANRSRARVHEIVSSPYSSGIVSLAVLSLLACFAETWAAGWGYRIVILGCGVFALRSVTQDERQHAVVRAVQLAGLLVITLAIKAAYLHGDAFSAAAAVLLFAVAAGAWAVALRSDVWMLAGGLCANLATFLLVRDVYLGVPLATWWVPLVQWEVLTAGVAALVWLWCSRRLSGFDTPCLPAYLCLWAGTGNALVLMPSFLAILVEPAGPMPGYMLQTGSVLGWVAFALSSTALLWYNRRDDLRGLHAAGFVALLLGCLAAATAGRWDTGAWLAHHVLTIAWSLAGLAILCLGARTTRRVDDAEAIVAAVRGWVIAIALCVVGLALRGAWGDPGRPYWSTGAVLMASLLVGALAVWLRRPRLVYISGLLPLAAGYVVWQAWLIDTVGVTAWIAWGPGVLDRFLFIEVICLAGSSVLWSATELWLKQRGFVWHGRAVPFRSFAVLAALQLLAVLVLGGVASDLLKHGVHIAGWLAWGALAVTGVASVLLSRDEEERFPAVHVVGLLAIALALHAAALAPARLLWAAGPSLAGYSLLTAAYSWRTHTWHRESFRWTQWCCLPPALALAAWVSIHFETWPERALGPLTTLLMLPAAGLLLFSGQVGSRSTARSVLLTLLVVLMAECAWSLIDPGAPGPWLNRMALLMIVLVLVGTACRALAPRGVLDEDSWGGCLRRVGPVLQVLAVLVMIDVVVQEFLLYDPIARHAPLANVTAALVALALIWIIVECVQAALLQGLDPLGFLASARTLYVYAAEGVLVLLLLHLRFIVPDIFPGFIGRNWTLVTMAIAYGGVGLAELLARRGLLVLATPLRRTWVFVPWVPILAFLARPLAQSAAWIGELQPGLQPFLRMLERIPSSYLLHVTLWMLLALLYAWNGWMRRAPRYGLGAGLAFNFGLWVIWANDPATAFTQHPQLWLIPVAVLLIVAEHIYHERLPGAIRGNLRILGLTILYASSTADMFIIGLDQSQVLPVILALLSVAGVLAGILLRVRAFLAFGVGFLFVVIFAEIWHAAVHHRQTWVWWASGVVLGAAILALFALFEKRRDDLLRLLVEIKQWE